VCVDICIIDIRSVVVVYVWRWVIVGVVDGLFCCVETWVLNIIDCRLLCIFILIIKRRWLKTRTSARLINDREMVVSRIVIGVKCKL